MTDRNAVAHAPSLSDDELADIKGHKVFVSERADGVCIEMVNDDRPLVRIRLDMHPDEAREVVEVLQRAARRQDNRAANLASAEPQVCIVARCCVRTRWCHAPESGR